MKNTKTVVEANKIKEVVLYDSYNAYKGVFDYKVASIQDDVLGSDYEVIPVAILEVLEEIGTMEEIENMSFEQLREALDIYESDILDDYDYENYYEMQREDTLEVISQLVTEYETTYKTTVAKYKLGGERYSHYGSIGGNGRTGANLVDDVEAFFTLGGDDVVIKINEDREIEVTTLDHDGSTTYQVAFITEKEVAKVENRLDYYGGDIDESIVEKYRYKSPTIQSRKALNKILGV